MVRDISGSKPVLHPLQRFGYCALIRLTHRPVFIPRKDVLNGIPSDAAGEHDHPVKVVSVFFKG